MVSMKPELLARYRDLARIFLRHGRRDLIEGTELDGLAEEADERAGGEAGKPAQLAEELEALGPTFIKLGQLLSTRRDLLPESYCEALSRLQDDVEEIPYEEVEQIVTESLGVRISKAFRTFDPEPLAAASLAQTHRAELRNGRVVAVKVQRPGIRKRVALDLEALENVAALLERHSQTARRYRIGAVIGEFKRTLVRELDFQREALNLERMGETLAAFERIVVPQPIRDYTAEKVLTMEYVEGTKIDAVNRVVHTELPGAELADELFRAYLHQVLVEGTFHADPHPGNVFLTHDGRIALLDLGMVGHVQPSLQSALLRLLLAIAGRDGERTADVALELADEVDDSGVADFRRAIIDLVAAHAGTTLDRVPVGRLVMEVVRLAASNGVLVPPVLSVLGKTLLNLDRIASCLDPDFDPSAAIRRSADEVMSARVATDASRGGVLAGLLDAKEFAETLPARANRIVETLAENRFKIAVEALDLERLIGSVEKVANRITAGLVLAALIIGASMLTRVETGFTLFGYPGLAMILFLAAVTGGFWLLLAIAREDRRKLRRP